MSPRRVAVALALALALQAAGCAAVGDLLRPGRAVGRIELEEAEAQLDRAERELEAGDLDLALRRLEAVRDLPGLSPETRVRSEALVDRTAAALLARAGDDPDALERLWEADVSPRMRARAGVRFAEALLAEGRRVKAFQQVRALEEELPTHPERARAGDVVARAGFDLIDDRGRYWLLFSYRARGFAALEYLVQTHPLHPEAPRAYEVLARAYEEDGELDLALERSEYLLLYHPETPQAVAAEARIPELRLERLESPVYDRGEMRLALEEARNWLRRHPGAPQEERVRATEDRALRMLAESDLRLAAYHRRIGNAFGERLHAERALDLARQAGDAEREARAEAVIAALEGAGEAG